MTRLRRPPGGWQDGEEGLRGVSLECWRAGSRGPADTEAVLTERCQLSGLQRVTSKLKCGHCLLKQIQKESGKFKLLSANMCCVSAKMPRTGWSFTNVLCFLLISSFFPSVLPAVTAVGKTAHGPPLRQSRLKKDQH